MGTAEIKNLIRELASKKINMAGRDFLLTWEKSRDELDATFLVADILRAMREKNISPLVFARALSIKKGRPSARRSAFF